MVEEKKTVLLVEIFIFPAIIYIMKHKDDPIIQELRSIRKETEEECKKKGQSYFDYLLEIQDKFKDRLVDEPLDNNEIEIKSA